MGHIKNGKSQVFILTPIESSKPPPFESYGLVGVKGLALGLGLRRI